MIKFQNFYFTNNISMISYEGESKIINDIFDIIYTTDDIENQFLYLNLNGFFREELFPFRTTIPKKILMTTEYISDFLKILMKLKFGDNINSLIKNYIFKGFTDFKCIHDYKIKNDVKTFGINLLVPDSDKCIKFYTFIVQSKEINDKIIKYISDMIDFCKTFDFQIIPIEDNKLLDENIITDHITCINSYIEKITDFIVNSTRILASNKCYLQIDNDKSNFTKNIENFTFIENKSKSWVIHGLKQSYRDLVIFPSNLLNIDHILTIRPLFLNLEIWNNEKSIVKRVYPIVNTQILMTEMKSSYPSRNCHNTICTIGYTRLQYMEEVCL